MQNPFLIFIVILCFSFSTKAQEVFKTHSVSIFKNGSAFYLKSGTVNTTDNKYVWKEAIPDAVFGTLWLQAPGGALTAARSYVDTVVGSVDVSNLMAQIKLMEGKKAKMSFYGASNEQEIVEGTIQEVFPAHFILKTGEGWATYHLKDVKKIMYEDQPITKKEYKTTRRIIELGFKNAKARQPLDVMYLQKGLGWVPSYLVEIIDQNKTKVTLRAVVINDSEDLEQVDLNFVVGVPNFRFDHMASPLTNMQNLAQTLQQLGNTSKGAEPLSNFAITFNPETYEEQVVLVPEEKTVPEGSEEQDLFFYTISKVDLKRGERAFYDLMSMEVPIDHVYQVNLQANTEHSNYADSFEESESKRSKVTHTIRMENKGTTPWTTGTAMVVNAREDQPRPISQDMLKFTPSGGESFLTITTSTDIFVTESEVETSREREIKRRGSYRYDLLQVTGKIKIKNYKSSSVKMQLHKDVAGNLKETSDDWLVTNKIQQGNNVNKVNKVCWEIEVKAGEEKIIEYDYEVYTRN